MQVEYCDLRPRGSGTRRGNVHQLHIERVFTRTSREGEDAWLVRHDGRFLLVVGS